METGSGISCRQFRRMLLIEIGSIGCLFVTLWAGNENGLLVVLMSIIGGLIYGSIIMKIGQIGDGYEAVTERVLNGFWWRFVWILYILRFVIRAAWILSYLEYLIRETLYDGSRLMVLLPLLLLCGYAGMRNPEGRARFVELLFWWIIIPLVGLFLIGLWKADLGSLMPTAEVSLPSLWQGDYRLMVLYLPVELILFRMMSGRENGKELWRAVLSSILAAGLWMLLVYSVTAGILGAAWSGKSLLGVTEAMELIAVHGGGLERLDILLILVWLVGGIVTLSAYCTAASASYDNRSAACLARTALSASFGDGCLLLYTGCRTVDTVVSAICVLGGCSAFRRTATSDPVGLSYKRRNERGSVSKAVEETAGKGVLPFVPAGCTGGRNDGMQDAGDDRGSNLCGGAAYRGGGDGISIDLYPVVCRCTGGEASGESGSICGDYSGYRYSESGLWPIDGQPTGLFSFAGNLSGRQHLSIAGCPGSVGGYTGGYTGSSVYTGI